MSEVVTASEVVGFWRQAGEEKWFRGGPRFDALCRVRLLPTHLAASRAELADWEHDAEGSLALVLLLDQIPRNVFRGSAHAYATDPLARAVAERAIGHGHDMQTDAALRRFYYLPFTHSEALLDQQRSLELYQSLEGPDPAKWARHHHGIIERFGRFPHRNALFGRATTPVEQAWLEEGGFTG